MRDREASEAGFTLIEMMVTVALIAILAALALPAFFGETRKAKAAAEVQPMFNDLRVRLEQYLQETGSYPPTIGEGSMFPASAPGPTPVPLGTLRTEWQTAKVRISGMDQVRCRYTWATGRPSPLDDANVGDVAHGTPPAGFGFSAPVTDWYYLLAQCDMDGANDGTVDTFSWYFTSSIDPTIRKLNDGN